MVGGAPKPAAAVEKLRSALQGPPSTLDELPLAIPAPTATLDLQGPMGRSKLLLLAGHRTLYSCQAHS